MDAGLPDGCENISSITSQEMGLKFIKALSLLQQPLQQMLEDCHPNCLVADAMFPWATEVAGKLKIPRLVFHGTSYFALNKIKMTRLQQPVELRESSVYDEIKKLMNQAFESEITRAGTSLCRTLQEGYEKKDMAHRPSFSLQQQHRR
ncbi:hypothetical protein QQP08_025267 [Theobroma cacao]|nr:hypothetical protein QQP08_025267 [Theobroma cacao]